MGPWRPSGDRCDLCAQFSQGSDFAGDGSSRQTLETRVGSLRLADHVRFLGDVGDMPSFYRSVDVFVLPSLSEGFPLTVLEAMASGLPVVATDVGGTKEAVRDGVDGRIVAPGNSASLEEALIPLLNSEVLRNRMGNMARARVVGHFSIESQIDKMSTIYAKNL